MAQKKLVHALVTLHHRDVEARPKAASVCPGRTRSQLAFDVVADLDDDEAVVEAVTAALRGALGVLRMSPPLSADSTYH